MGLQQWGAATGVIVAFVAVCTLLFTIQCRLREQRVATERRELEIYEKGHRDGVQSQTLIVRLADETSGAIVRQLTSERDDARGERERARMSADEGWRRYYDIRDRGRQ